VRHHRLRGPLRPDLFLGLAEGERLGLGEDVRRQYVVVVAERIEALAKADEVDRVLDRLPVEPEAAAKARALLADS